MPSVVPGRRRCDLAGRPAAATLSVAVPDMACRVLILHRAAEMIALSRDLTTRALDGGGY